MKVNRKNLFKLIEEAIEEQDGMPDLTPGMELASDVVRVKDAMGNIDNKDEYTQLLTLVLKMSGDISGAEEILRQAMKQLPEFVAQLDGQIDEWNLNCLTSLPYCPLWPR